MERLKHHFVIITIVREIKMNTLFIYDFERLEFEFKALSFLKLYISILYKKAINTNSSLYYQFNIADFMLKICDFVFYFHEFRFKIDDFLFNITDFELKIDDFEFNIGDFEFKIDDYLFNILDFEFKFGDFVITFCLNL